MTIADFSFETGAKLEGEVECDFAVVEGHMLASLVSREVATIGPSARIAGDVIYNVLELDRVRARRDLLLPACILYGKEKA